MTPTQISLLRESFAAVTPIAEEAAALFYERLFTLDPGLRPLFAGTDMAAQGRKLMQALAYVVGALDAPANMLAALRSLGERHAGYGVEERHYATVGQALLWTLGQGLGARFTPAMHEAWAAAYAVVSVTMIDAARARPTLRAAA
ncbi:MAG: hypothetical protein K2X74_18690 [Acetobacteraceae bacterium]|nr:hypothetical protein [Acetobacteraceae bacterium]